MVHTGAIVSAGMARGESKLLPSGFQCFHYNTFDNPKDRRDFVSMGAAAGVAAAFNAPLGGILFSLEEVSSYWNARHMWRVFVCATICSFTVNILIHLKNASMTTRIVDEGLILFGQAGQFEAFTFTSFRYWEIPIFAAIGVAGGLLGALFNACSKHLNVFRKRAIRQLALALQCCPALEITGGHSRSKREKQAQLESRVVYLRVMEAVLTMACVSSIFFWVPSTAATSTCRLKSAVDGGNATVGAPGHRQYHS